MILEIKNLHVAAGDKEIVSGVSLTVKQGEVHVIMGPNGSGKTTLAKALLGYPGLKITEGDILVDGTSIKEMPTNKRAALGIFLGFQNPVEIDGVGFISLLRYAKQAIEGKSDIKKLMTDVKEGTKNLSMNSEIIGRAVNKDLSGGEKKKAEILQMEILKPKIAILDEPDSGLDVDAVRVVAANINRVIEETNAGLLLITHYSRILEYMKPTHVHVMLGGKIVAEGGIDIVKNIEEHGYEIFGNAGAENSRKERL
ncbi:MAG: Fe-S cluster assembly ATPase SufC [Candidatus Micrarchaeaceae archaeon]